MHIEVNVDLPAADAVRSTFAMHIEVNVDLGVAAARALASRRRGRGRRGGAGAGVAAARAPASRRRHGVAVGRAAGYGRGHVAERRSMSEERRHTAEPAPVAAPGAVGVAAAASPLQALAGGAGNVAMRSVASGAGTRAAPRRPPAPAAPPCETSRALARAVLARQEPQTEPAGKGDPFVPDPRPAHAPHHLEPLDPWASPEEIQSKQGEKMYAAVMAEAAARAYGPGHQLHRDLVYHYVYGGGAPFALDAGRMKEVIAPGGGNTWLNFFQSPFGRITAKMKELEGQLPQTSDAEENREVSAEVSDQAAVGCDADKPSLGMFTVMVNGTLTARRKGTDSDEVVFEFTGTMRWFDVWDFDPRLKATAQQQAEAEGKLPISTRTKKAEEDTRTAHDFLPGKGFNVDTPDVPVTQKSGEKPQW